MKIQPIRLGDDLAKIVLVVLALLAVKLARATAQGVDLLPFWAAGRLVLEGHAAQAYDLSVLQGIEKTSGAHLIFPFLNPPPFLLLFSPFSLLPYQGALAAFDAVCLAVYMTGAWPLLKGGRFLMAVFPPVLLNLLLGQNSLLVAGLFIWAMRILPSRPIAAGVLIGMMTIKPQLGLLIPLALIAGRYWRAFIAAAATTLALFGAAELMMPGTTAAFVANSAYSGGLIESPLLLAKLHTVYAGLRLAHAPLAAAWLVQGVCFLGVAGLVWLSWRRPGEVLPKAAVLAAATPLATPYVFDYDLAILALPLMLTARARPVVAAIGFVAPALTRLVALTAQVALGPLVSALVLWSALRLQGQDAKGRLPEEPALKAS